MFTPAGTLEFDSEVGGNTFAEHREDILRLARSSSRTFRGC